MNTYFTSLSSMVHKGIMRNHTDTLLIYADHTSLFKMNLCHGFWITALLRFPLVLIFGSFIFVSVEFPIQCITYLRPLWQSWQCFDFKGGWNTSRGSVLGLWLKLLMSYWINCTNIRPISLKASLPNHITGLTKKQLRFNETCNLISHKWMFLMGKT